MDRLSLRRLRIVIPGGTGHLGHILARHFHEQGHDVTVIARHLRQEKWAVIPWNAFELDEWAKSIDGADVVVNLAGRSVNCRYTAANQREIRQTRTIPTGLIAQAIARSSNPPRVWLNASTATIYRHSIESMDEVTGVIGTNEVGKWRFSADVAQEWERALLAEPLPKTRRVAMRTAMVMSPDPGGAFDAFLNLVRWGFGGKIASGQQYISWIHDVDWIRAIEFLIEREDLSGAVNLTSPCPLRNRQFMKHLRAAWCTSYWGIPTPGWALPIGAMILRTETELVLKSRYVAPKRLCEAGFDFHFPNWRGACQDLVARWRQLHSD